MLTSKDILLGKLRGGESMAGREQLALTFLLALPAILAQLSMCLMSYIDSAMVGRLGSGPAASVGLVSTTTWLVGSFCYANSSGFSVQISHRCGARDFEGARKVFRHGLVSVIVLSLALCSIAVALSGTLPRLLGGGPDIVDDASAYFRIYALFLPAFQLAVYSEGSLIASGNMKVPSIVSMMMCLLDVVFNYLFIFIMGMGAKGAALGTGLAEACAALFLLIYVFRTSPELKQSASEFLQPVRKFLGTKTPAVEKASVPDPPVGDRNILEQALHISWPLWLQNLISRGAYVASTVLIAPLGTVAVAANSFAVIAEGFCYLPGYGMQDAATTLIGQSIGAKRKDLARRFAWITIGSGASMMALLSILMYAFAPGIMGLLSMDPEVITLGAQCLRIEAFAELLFGVSIVAHGCCVGAGDTVFPSMVNLLSMWIVRIGLAVILIPRMGLAGYWVAMATELSVKGVIFALYIRSERWMKTKLTYNENNR